MAPAVVSTTLPDGREVVIAVTSASIGAIRVGGTPLVVATGGPITSAEQAQLVADATDAVTSHAP